MEQKNYSIIIPHKNSATFLNRCLKSIPFRDDIEVIVVDDYSNDYEDVKKIISLFPQVKLYNNEGYGAGGARNTGLSKAHGKWLLFADCDDYYVEGFLEELDKYVNSEYDVIYFNFFMYIEGKEEPVDEKISNYIKECAKGCISADFVKYRNNAPWNKMIRREFVELYQIQFEEQPIANDMFFSFSIGYLCKKYLIVNAYLYKYIVYKKSQTNRNWNRAKIKTFLENTSKYNGFVTFVNHKEWTHGLPFICLQLYKYGIIDKIFAVMWYYFSHIGEIRKVQKKYPIILKKKEIKL